MHSKERNTFSLNLKTQKVVDFIESEKSKAGESKTSFMNKLLECLADWPVLLTSHMENPSIIDEVKAVKALLSDAVMEKTPQFAAHTRRDSVQMILHLVEVGMVTDKQLTPASTRNVYELRSSIERSDEGYLDIEPPQSA